MNSQALILIWLCGAVWYSIRLAQCLPYVVIHYIERQARNGDKVAMNAELQGTWLRVVAALASWIVITLVGCVGGWFLIALAEGRRFFRFYTEDENDKHISRIIESVNRRP